MATIINIPNLKQLARCRKTENGYEIHIRPHVTPIEFIEYFRGNREGASAHKKTVLAELAKKDWPLTRIQNLIRNPYLVRRFLLLHEGSHIRHRDHLRYHSMTPEELTQIETRACLEALVKMSSENKYQPSSCTHTRQKQPA